MCGISFYCNLKQDPQAELLDSLEKTKHRGPDSSGTYFNKINNYFIGLGHNRLSIIDLSDAGKQPMRHSQSIIISYNGEIYNHAALRELLINKGCTFISTTDTEIILHLYAQFGVASFAMLRGMFAFVILDEDKEKFILVRDTVGIKPLYITQTENGIYGSSEIRGLKSFTEVSQEINKQDIYEFFNNGFLYEPATGFSHIKKLMPGHYLELDLTSSLQKSVCYQSIQDCYSDGSLNDLLKSAIHQQEFADVPVGVFFSGGTDSSIIASSTNNANLLFANYDKDVNSDIDQIYSKKIAEHLNKNLKTANLTSDNSVDAILDSIAFVAKNTEELVSDYTFWSMYKLSSMAYNNQFKVMLSGIGGDEAFGGYPRYRVLKNHRLIKLANPLLKFALTYQLFPKSLNKKFERLVAYSSEKHWPTAYSRLLGYFNQTDLNELFNNASDLQNTYRLKLDEIEKSYQGNSQNKIKLAQHYDLTGFLAHNLTVADKASMLASIELRVPLLDEAVMSYGMRLKSKELIKGKQLKKPLLDLLNYFLPTQLTKRPKTGFNPPLDNIIKKIGSSRLASELKPIYQYINPTHVDTLIEQHFTKKANNTYKLWQLLYFSYWLQENQL